MSETRQSSPSHPHLSTEIFFHILSLVPIDHILPFRTLCRAVRDEMNTRVLYSYIRRTKLLSFTVPNDIDDEFLESLNLRALSGGIATFSHLEPRFSNVPIWTRTHAVFRFDAEWIDAFRRLSNYDAAVIQHSLRIGSHPETNPAWFVQLDNAVLDLDFKPENRLQVTADPYNGDILITWRTMLRSFLVTETKLSSMIVQHTVQVRLMTAIAYSELILMPEYCKLYLQCRRELHSSHSS
jgi:hypothetical protein